MFFYLEKKTLSNIWLYSRNIIQCLPEIKEKGQKCDIRFLHQSCGHCSLTSELCFVCFSRCIAKTLPPTLLLCSCSVWTAKRYNILCPLFFASYVTPDLTNAPCRHTWNGTFPKVIRHLLPLAARPGRSHFKVTQAARSLSMEAVCTVDQTS